MPSAVRRDGETLEIRLLGGVEVVRDGARQALPASRKTRGLLAYLALAARPCRREDLCDLLWDDVADPRRELRWSLSKLRALLGPWLIASRDDIVVAGHGLTVDVTAFRRVAASNQTDHDIRDALALWRGEPLANAGVPGLHRFHVWWTAEREALEELHRRMLHERVDRQWPSPSDALGLARSLVMRYPLDEWGHARVAQALKRTGRIADAHAYVEATRQALGRELGLAPSTLMTDSPAEPEEKPTAGAREKRAPRPKLGIFPLQVPHQDEALQAMAMHIATALAHGLWQSGLCDVAELDWPPFDARASVSDLSYAVHGSLIWLDGGMRLLLRCVDAQRGTVLWFARFGPGRSSGTLPAGWVGKAVGAIQSMIQTTEMRRALRRGDGQDQSVHDLLYEALALSLAMEPIANQRALALVDAALSEAPDQPLGLALAAWCHAQRSIYNWSADPDGDRGDAERFCTAAARLAADDPTCLTVLGAARSQVADQTSAHALLGRTLQLNPHSAWAHTRSGWVAIYLDRPEQAARHFRASLGLAPLQPGIFNSMTGLGIAHFLKGEHRHAIGWMEKALALNPRAIWIHRNLAPAHIAAGRQAEAERCVRALLDAYPRLSVAAVCDAMVMSRPAMHRIAGGLAQAGLPRN